VHGPDFLYRFPWVTASLFVHCFNPRSLALGTFHRSLLFSSHFCGVSPPRPRTHSLPILFFVPTQKCDAMDSAPAIRRVRDGPQKTSPDSFTPTPPPWSRFAEQSSSWPASWPFAFHAFSTRVSNSRLMPVFPQSLCNEEAIRSLNHSFSCLASSVKRVTLLAG